MDSAGRRADSASDGERKSAERRGRWTADGARERVHQNGRPGRANGRHSEEEETTPRDHGERDDEGITVRGVMRGSRGEG